MKNPCLAQADLIEELSAFLVYSLSDDSNQVIWRRYFFFGINYGICFHLVVLVSAANFARFVGMKKKK